MTNAKRRKKLEIRIPKSEGNPKLDQMDLRDWMLIGIHVIQVRAD